MRTLCPKARFPSADTMALLFGTICPKDVGMPKPNLPEITSFRSIIELWGSSREAMAADLRSTNPDVTGLAISKWWQRDKIPSEWWSAVLATERASSAGVTAEILTRLAAREPAESRT